jgi:hypothetical protein
VNRKRQRATEITVASCSKTSLYDVVADGTIKDQFGGRRGSREANSPLTVSVTFFDIRRLDSSAGIVISNKRELSSAPVRAALTFAHRFIMQPFAYLAEVQARERFTPYPLLTV